MVVDLIYGEEHQSLAVLEENFEKQIIVKPRGSFHQEQYDIFGQSASALKGKDTAATRSS